VYFRRKAPAHGARTARFPVDPDGAVEKTLMEHGTPQIGTPEIDPCKPTAFEVRPMKIAGPAAVGRLESLQNCLPAVKTRQNNGTTND